MLGDSRILKGALSAGFSLQLPVPLQGNLSPPPQGGEALS